MKEIIKITADDDLNNLAIYEKERDFLNRIRDKVIKSNDEKFADGLKNLKVHEVTHCVQNFYNLRILTERIQNSATEIMKVINEGWKKLIYSEYENSSTGRVIFGNSLKSLL